MDKVLVMLSSYNGQKYILEQIESVLKQKHVEVSLLIRDDGSTDDTRIILNKLKRDNITIEFGSNIGYAKSFLWLLYNSDDSYDYYAFCDQDDIWDDDKLFSAISCLKKNDANVYCGTGTLVDENLKYLGKTTNCENSFKKTSKILNSGGMGCTMVFNKEILNIIRKYYPQNIWPHDYWVTMVGLFVGRVIYDNKSYMMYRQHDFNVTGGKRVNLNKINRKIKNIKRLLSNPWSTIAYDIYNGYYEYIDKNFIEELENVINSKYNFRSRIKLLKNRKLYKESYIKNIFLYLLILSGRI